MCVGINNTSFAVQGGHSLFGSSVLTGHAQLSSANHRSSSGVKTHQFGDYSTMVILSLYFVFVSVPAVLELSNHDPNSSSR